LSAITREKIDANTEKAPFTAHAHGTRYLWNLRTICIPMGKHIPIKKPGGIINTTAIKILTGLLSHIKEVKESYKKRI
jgi:hypothetical protein